jgi:Mrp family chromosome partitioning ATPase
MGQLLDALKRLEIPAPRAAEQEAIAASSLKAADRALKDGTALRNESQILQTMGEAESAVAELTAKESPIRNVIKHDQQHRSQATGLNDQHDVLNLAVNKEPLQTLAAHPPFFPPPLPKASSPKEISIAAEGISGVFSEMARKLFSQIPTGQASALFFTSPRDGEGKTETLLGLLPVLPAQGMGRMLVVDANFRRPSLTRRLAKNTTPGLGEVLWTMADWDTAIQSTAIRNVDVLPNFGLPKMLGRATEPQGFDALLKSLRKNYSLVLIDAASLAYAETAVLAAVCDGVYLVVRLGQASRYAVRSAVDVLARSGSRLWGCVAVGGGKD